MSMHIQEPNTHFLVHWSYDAHHKIYGVFSSVELAIQSIELFPKDDEERQAIIDNYQIDEYKGDVLVDTIYVADIIEELL